MRNNTHGRISPYVEAYYVIRKAYKENKERPLTRSSAQITIESTPGLRFHPGTTMEEVFKQLVDWRLINYFEPAKVGHFNRC